MIIATTTLILGFSWMGTPERRGTGLILVAISVVAWIGFIVIEKRAEAPILDPQVFQNRTFMTVAGTSVLSLFGTLGIMAYSPIFAQQVMNVSPSLNGSMLTPYSLLTAFLGIPAGFWLARTRRYKGLYILGYAIVTIAMVMMWRFTANTPIWLFVFATSIAGLGIGAIPTINTVVAQSAVPRRLLGVAVGATYFFQMVGMAAAPAFIGLAQNSAPDLESGLKLVFLIGAACALASLILVFTIPALSMEKEPPG